MVDADELPSAAEIRGAAARLGLKQFAERYPAPGLHLTLHVSARPRAGEDDRSEREKSIQRTAMDLPSAGSALRYNDKVAFLAKRPGNPFPNMVSIGRALNNDVVVTLSTVSKLHGYFMCDGASWTFIDHGSKNGTRINDVALKPSERRALQPGDRLRLGLELIAIFLPADALYDFLRRSSSGASP